MKDIEAKSTKMSIHSLKNLLGNEEQTSLFSNHDKEFADKYGITLINTINQFGIDLTDIQSRIMEGILKGFSQTGYKGNINPKHKEEISTQFSGQIPESYKYVNEVPRIRATQSQILDWAGIKKNSIASITRALEALDDIATTQFCFYYDRLAFSDDGVPLVDKDGKWKKEQIVSVDTLFHIKKVTQESTQSLSYYEITPSAIFLDQIEGYFVLIPFKWREEVRKLVGDKKASAYTFRFLLFLRYQYELKRRSTNTKNAPQIRWSPEEIAIAIKMPESIYKRKKERRDEILENAYSVAKKLGYLSEYERLGYIDVLTFNAQKYSLLPTNLEQNIENAPIEIAANQDSIHLLSLFIECRKTLDSQYVILDSEKTIFIKEFCELLKQRSREDVENIIKWSTKQKYWSTRLSTPVKLIKSFSEAWIEYNISKTTSKEDLIQDNKKIAWKELKDIHERCEKTTVFPSGIANLSLLDKGVEIVCGSQCVFTEYSDPNFWEKLKSSLARYRFPT